MQSFYFAFAIPIRSLIVCHRTVYVRSAYVGLGTSVFIGTHPLLQ